MSNIGILSRACKVVWEYEYYHLKLTFRGHRHPAVLNFVGILGDLLICIKIA